MFIHFQQLKSYRSQQPHFKGTSFTTISAFGPHASIIHYNPTQETDIPINNGGLYLGIYLKFHL